MESKYVVFTLGKERYGLPIENVERILPDQNVTRIPKTPKMMLGVFELRGSTLPAMDARLRFDMPAGEAAKNMVVVLTDEGRCAVRVDEVAGIESLTEDQIEPKNDLITKSEDDFIWAVGKNGDRLTVLLDPQNLVPKAMRKNLVAAA